MRAVQCTAFEGSCINVLPALALLQCLPSHLGSILEFGTKSVNVERRMLSPLQDQTCKDCVQGVTTRCTGVIDCICSIAISDVQQVAKIDARGHKRMQRQCKVHRGALHLIMRDCTSNECRREIKH